MSVVAFVLTKRDKSKEKHVFNSHPSKKDVMVVDMVETPLDQARLLYKKYLDEGFFLRKPSEPYFANPNRYRGAYPPEDAWLDDDEPNFMQQDPVADNHPMFDDYDDLTNDGDRDDWDISDREDVRRDQPDPSVRFLTGEELNFDTQ